MSTSSNNANTTPNKILEWVRLYGGSTSEAVLDPSCSFLTLSDQPGFIGYRDEKGCMVALGDPICPPENKEALVKAFHEKAAQEEKNIVYLTVTQGFHDWALKKVCSASVEFGKEFYLDPHFDPRECTGVKVSLVRRKVKHAQHEGVTIHEYDSFDPKIEQAIEQVGIDWLKTRRGPQIHISNIQLFKNKMGKRWLYAEKNGKIVGVLTLNQIKAKDGWLLNRYMVTKDAPGGTPELLVISAIEKLRLEGCKFLHFGSVPDAALGEVSGLGFLTSWIGRFLFKMANTLFHLEGKRQFWEKFHPQSEKSYLLFDKPNIGTSEIRGLLRSMNVTF